MRPIGLTMTVTALFTLILSGFSHYAIAQTAWRPSRQIQVVVPYPPGGSADYFARTIFNKMAGPLGQAIVFENIAGAGGIVGTKTVIKAAPDGHTLVVSSIASTIIPPSMTTPPAFDVFKDLTPITGIGTVPAVLVVRPSLGPKSWSELLAYLRANPGKVNLATSGNGTISHLTGELLMRETKTQIVAVHYRGAPPAVTDLLGAHVDIMFSDAPFFLEHIKAGKLLALAVGTERRAPSLPEVPTTAEFGASSIVATNTYSLFGPPRMPREIVVELNRLVVEGLKDPEVLANFDQQAAIPAGDTPERFTAAIGEEAARWIPIVEAAGLKGK